MAKPELEDGYTPIANEILEKLARTPLPPNQWRVLVFIIRKTYGFHKKVDYIANFQIVEGTGLCKAVVSRCLKKLSKKQVITRRGKHLGLQKDWEKWGLAIPSTLASKLAEPSTSEKLAIPSTELVIPSTKVSSCAVTQKIKDTLTKDKPLRVCKKQTADSEVQKIFEQMRAYQGYPEKTDKDPIPNYGKEGKAIKRMLARGFTPIEIFACWRSKVDTRGEFVSMTWVNEDIGKAKQSHKGGNGEYGTSEQHPEGIPGNRPAGAFADLAQRDS